MTRAALVALMLASASAYADDADVDERIRKLYEQGDYPGVRREILRANEQAPKPQWLFALGQVELQLGNYDAAIAYYERFLATSPPQDQAALAQQAIGAARMRMKQPPPPPPPTPTPPRKPAPPRRWFVEDTAIVALGGAAALVGGGLLVHSHRLGNDRSGSLTDYDERLANARTTRWVGAGLIAGGVLVAGVAVLRWRLRPDGGELTAVVSPAGIGVLARW